MRILWLNWRDITNPSAGGAELYTHQIALRLAQRGHEVTLFTSAYPKSQHQEIRDGVKIVRKGNSLSVYLEAPRFFRSQNKHGSRFDIIIDAVNTIPFLSPLYVRGAMVVALLYQLTGEIFLREFFPPVGYLLYALERRSYLPWCLTRADRVVTLSESNKRELIDVCQDLNSEKVFVIPPGVDHDNFKPGRKSDEPLLLFMNRLVRYKQPEHLVVAMKEVCALVPNAKLVIVGTLAGNRYATHLRQIVRTLRLEKNIIFHPSRPFLANKILLLQQAWIHALPSMKEGFGLSILEAAACETPTVAYDVTGVRDAVMQGETGLLARAGDISSFTTHLIDLLTNQDKRKLLGKQAAKWSANYSWAKSADKFVEVIRATDVHSREIVRSYVPNSSIGVTSPVA